ncbi:MAG: sugar ABC transporter permease [Ruminococcaceae bacterium]|nr:sugar ABC transporter permease [Oscillospiraceae bacterium]
MSHLGLRARKGIADTLCYVVLILLSILWVFPIVWVVLTSFRAEGGSFVTNFIPKTFTLQNYVNLFADTSVFSFGQWFANTAFVAVCSCLLTTFITVSTAFVMSRMRFRLRKPMMKLALILGMFPAFMSMIAVYFVLKSVGLTQSLLALILVYSAGGGLSFYITKGFFDTIPRAVDEAARIDGATNSQIFFRIILPLSKPIIVYTVLTTFMAPWMDFIFAKVIMGDNYSKYTVAIGLYTMLNREFIDQYFTRFAAGAVCIAVPITILFIALQKYYVEGVTGGAVKG